MANWESLRDKEKKYCIALVAYLVNPIDIIPEGALAAQDLLMTSSLRASPTITVIADTSAQFVSAFWKGEKKIFESLCAISASAKETLPELHNEVTKAFQSVFS